MACGEVCCPHASLQGAATWQFSVLIPQLLLMYFESSLMLTATFFGNVDHKHDYKVTSSITNTCARKQYFIGCCRGEVIKLFILVNGLILK